LARLVTDGSELFFLNGSNVMGAKIDANFGTSSQVTRRFTVTNLFQSPSSPTYDIAPDGKSFATVVQNEKSPAAQLNVIFNWFDESRYWTGTPYTK
jgi:hypothetical protein